MNDSALTIFIPVWGDKHLDYLQRYALPSLMQPRNLPACKFNKIYVECATTEADKEKARRVIEGGLAALNHVELRLNTYDPNASGRLFVPAIQHAIRFCRETQTRLWFCQPDMIIGNGSMANVINYARHKPVSVAGVHLRVLATEFEQWHKDKMDVIENTELVRAAWKMQHQSIASSWVDQDNSTFLGGVSLTKLSEGLVTAIHCLPNVILAWFTQEDQDYFDTASYHLWPGPWVAWDHYWPAALVEQGRFRVCGSSDMFCALELTEPQFNNVGITPGSAWGERYAVQHHHNKACNCFLVTLRS